MCLPAIDRGASLPENDRPARCEIEPVPGADPAAATGSLLMLALAGRDLYKPRHLTRGPWLLAVRWLHPRVREGSSRVRGGSTGEPRWRYPTTPCVSSWKLAFT